MEKILNFLKSKYFLLFALAILNLLVAFYFLKLSPWSSDSETYLNAMKYLQGAELGDVPYNRLLTTPFMLYSSILASWFTGSFYGGILAVNLIFYFLIIYVFYKLVLEIYQNQTTAVLSSILLLSNYSMYNYGVTYNADLGGWFFFVLGSFFAVKYFEKTRATVLAALLPASLAFLAWPALTQRIAFIIVPWLALISGFGLSKIKNNYIIGTILIAYALINYSITTFLIKIINLPF